MMKPGMPLDYNDPRNMVFAVHESYGGWHRGIEVNFLTKITSLSDEQLKNMTHDELMTIVVNIYKNDYYTDQ